MQALINLNRPLKVAMTGEGSDGWRLAMMKYKDQGLSGLSLGEPPMSSALALKTAVDILEGNKPPKDQPVPLPNVTTGSASPFGPALIAHSPRVARTYFRRTAILSQRTRSSRKTSLIPRGILYQF